MRSQISADLELFSETVMMKARKHDVLDMDAAAQAILGHYLSSSDTSFWFDPF